MNGKMIETMHCDERLTGSARLSSFMVVTLTDQAAKYEMEFNLHDKKPFSRML